MGGEEHLTAANTGPAVQRDALAHLRACHPADRRAFHFVAMAFNFSAAAQSSVPPPPSPPRRAWARLVVGVVVSPSVGMSAVELFLYLYQGKTLGHGFSGFACAQVNAVKGSTSSSAGARSSRPRHEGQAAQEPFLVTFRCAGMSK